MTFNVMPLFTMNSMTLSLNDTQHNTHHYYNNLYYFTFITLLLYAACHYAEYRVLFIIMLSVINVECRYAEFSGAKLIPAFFFCYAGCRSTKITIVKSFYSGCPLLRSIQM